MLQVCTWRSMPRNSCELSRLTSLRVNADTERAKQATTPYTPSFNSFSLLT